MPRARALELKSAITRTLSQAIRSSAFPRSSAEEAESVRQSLRCSSLALNHRDSRRSRKNAKTSAAFNRQGLRMGKCPVEEKQCKRVDLFGFSSSRATATDVRQVPKYLDSISTFLAFSLPFKLCSTLCRSISTLETKTGHISCGKDLPVSVFHELLREFS